MLIGNQIPTRPQPRKAHTLLQGRRSEVIWIWWCLALPQHPQQIHSIPWPTWLLERCKFCWENTPLPAESLAGTCCHCFGGPFPCRGTGSDVTPGCGAPSALLVGTEEAGSKDSREGPRLLEREAMKERIQGKDKIFPLLFSLSDLLLAVGYKHAYTTWIWKRQLRVHISYLCCFTFAKISCSKHRTVSLPTIYPDLKSMQNRVSLQKCVKQAPGSN